MSGGINGASVALPHGNDLGSGARGVDLTQARVRTRARVPITAEPAKVDVPVVSDTPDVAASPVLDALRRLLSALWADLRAAYVWDSRPASLREVVAVDPARAVPGDHTGLAAANRAWKWAVAVPVTAVLHALTWLCQHPLRLLPAIAVVAAIVSMWI